MERVVFFVTRKPKFVPSPFYLEGRRPTDKYLWDPIIDLLERKVVTCPDGKPGHWVTLTGGRKVCIPESYWRKKALTVGVTAGAVTAAVTAATLASSARVRAFVRGLHFAPEGAIQPLLGRHSLNFILKSPDVVNRSFRAAALTGFKVRRFGYYEYRGVKGLMIDGSLKNFPESKFLYATTKDPDVLWAGLISIPKASRKASRDLFRGVFDLTRASGASKIRFIAGLENGSSMWARLGGKWVDKGAENACKRAILERRRSIGYLADLDRLITEARTPKELVQKLDERLGKSGTRRLLRNVEWWGELDLKDPQVRSLLLKLTGQKL